MERSGEDDFWAFGDDAAAKGGRQGASGRNEPPAARKRRRSEDKSDEEHEGVGFVKKPLSKLLAGSIPWRNGRVIAAELVALHQQHQQGVTAAAASGTSGGLGHRGKAPAFFSLPSRSGLLRLHEEILDFVSFISPMPSETRIAAKALAAVKGCIAAVWPESRVEVFGSRANGLVLPTSDWDLVVFGASSTATSMRKLANHMESTGVAKKTEVIASARVPIVKAWEAGSGIQVDISFEATSAVQTRGAIQDLCSLMPTLRPLVVTLKYFLLQRGLNDTYSGGVGSFLLTLMCAHVVQVTAKRLGLPLLGLRTESGHEGGLGEAAGVGGQRAKKAKGSSKGGKEKISSASSITSATEGGAGSGQGGMNMGVLLLAFFEIYGSSLNYTATGISLRGSAQGWGSYYSKASRGWYDANRPQLLSLESPVDPSADVGKNSWAVQRVRRACMYAHTALARAVRAWEAGSAHGAGRGHGGSHGGGTMTYPSGMVGASPPPSILASVIRVDDTLLARMQEVQAQREETGTAVDSEGEQYHDDEEEEEEGPHEAGEEGERTSGRGAGGVGTGTGTGTGKKGQGLGGPRAQRKAARRVAEGGGVEDELDERPASKRAKPAVSVADLRGLPSHAEEKPEEDGGAGAGGGGWRHAAARRTEDDEGRGGAASLQSTQPITSSTASTSAGAKDDADHAVSAARAQAMSQLVSSTAGTGIALRKPRLLADVLSRKARGVPAVIPAPENGWF